MRNSKYHLYLSDSEYNSIYHISPTLLCIGENLDFTLIFTIIAANMKRYGIIHKERSEPMGTIKDKIILLVDDEPAILQMCQSILKENGFGNIGQHRTNSV